jgi:hypothetical protein
MSRVPSRAAGRRQLPPPSRRMPFRAVAEALRVVHGSDAGTLQPGDGAFPTVDGAAGQPRGRAAAAAMASASEVGARPMSFSRSLPST